MNSSISCLILMAIVAIFAIGLSLGGAITRDEITDSDQDANNVANVAAKMVMHLWNQELRSRFNPKRDYDEDAVMIDEPSKRRRPGCVYDIWKGRGLSRCT